MAIPVGKLALYTAAAGIYPARTLPGLARRRDRQPRAARRPAVPRSPGASLARPCVRRGRRGVRGRRRRVFPAAVVQWEDFKQHNAVRILERYRRRLPSFNDDMQGTAAVVLAGLLAARRERGGLTSDRFMFVGAGAAAIGIASLLRAELVAEGMDPRAAASAIVMLDSHGLVHTDRPAAAGRSAAVRGRSGSPAGGRAPTVRAGGPGRHRPRDGRDGPHRGIGLRRRVHRGPRPRSGAPRPRPDHASAVEPDACAEARPEDILTWTEGRALVATGGPGRDVSGPGGRHVDRSGEQRLRLPWDGSRRDRLRRRPR